MTKNGLSIAAIYRRHQFSRF